MNRLTNLMNFEQTEADPYTPVGNTLSSFEYKCYADGMRRTSIEGILAKNGTPGDTLKSQTVEYTYDNLNRLTLEVGDDDPLSASNGYSVQYEYDLVGNRLNRSVWFEHNLSAELYSEYEYNDRDQLLRETNSDTIPTSRLDLPSGSYYAYAGTGGGMFYTKVNSNVKIGQFKAWLIGLPSNISHWFFGLIMAMLVVAFFIPAIVNILIRLRGREPARLRLSLRHRCLSVLIAYVMLISPMGFEQAARASAQYSQLGVSSWGATDDVFSYCYDANGSQVYKVYYNVPDIENKTPADVHTWLSNNTGVAFEKYIYNLQNRLARVEKYSGFGSLTEAVEYKYNLQGIRVEKIEDPDGSPVSTNYLIDPYNHTGFAQTFEETMGTDTTANIIGDDVLAQVVNTGTVKYLLYDGHGSTRQLVSGTLNTMTIHDDFSYDGYGVLLQDETVASSDPGKVSQQATNLLYAGEHFDTDSQNYYNRARWYDPLNGRFNRVDPYSGNNQDPQSLHKYLYCHANPINSIDPSGLSLTGFVMAHPIISLVVILAAIITVAAITIPYINQIIRRRRVAPAEFFLDKTRRYMVSCGWSNPVAQPNRHNALLHTVANMIAVGSVALNQGIFESNEHALEIFQLRERGEALHTQMDRINNRIGNWIAQQEGDKLVILENTPLVWIEVNSNGEEYLVRKKYSDKRRNVEDLRILLAEYGLTDMNK